MTLFFYGMLSRALHENQNHGLLLIFAISDAVRALVSTFGLGFFAALSAKLIRVRFPRIVLKLVLRRLRLARAGSSVTVTHRSTSNFLHLSQLHVCV